MGLKGVWVTEPWVTRESTVARHLRIVMSMAQLQAIKLSSRANILASQAGKLAPGYNQFGSQISQL